MQSVILIQTTLWAFADTEGRLSLSQQMPDYGTEAGKTRTNIVMYQALLKESDNSVQLCAETLEKSSTHWYNMGSTKKQDWKLETQIRGWQLLRFGVTHLFQGAFCGDL